MTPRDRRAACLGVGGLVLIGIVFLGVLPGLDAWRAARGRLGDAQTQLAELQRKFERLEALDRRVIEAFGPGAGKPLEKLETARTEFYKTVVNVVSSGGIKVRQLQPEAVRPLREAPGAVVLSYQVQGMAEFGQLAQMLSTLRQSDRLVLVERVDANATPPGSGQLQVTLVLSTLAQQEGKR